MTTNLAKPKSLLTQLLLTLLFGPIGLLYSSLTAASLLLLATAFLTKDFGWHGIVFAWALAIATGVFTVRSWNRRAARYGRADAPPASSTTHA